MKNLLKNYYKIGMVAGPLSLWIDSYANENDSRTKMAKDFVEEHYGSLSSITRRVCMVGSYLVTAVALWPIFLYRSLQDLFSATE